MKSILMGFLLIGSFSSPANSTLEETLVEARKDNKQVLLYFSGSDWCLPCIKFKKRVLNDAEFKTSTSESIILYQVDFTRRDTADDETVAYKKKVAEEYNPEGSFPKVLLLDTGGNVLWEKDGYRNESVGAFLKMINNQGGA